MNLLILSVFMLDRQTWFQNGQLGKHNMFATIEYDPPKKTNAKHFFANITNWHSCLNRQSNLNHWTQFPWMQHFLDRFADLHCSLRFSLTCTDGNLQAVVVAMPSLRIVLVATCFASASGGACTPVDSCPKLSDGFQGCDQK
jgi:hypothetical protein